MPEPTSNVHPFEKGKHKRPPGNWRDDADYLFEHYLISEDGHGHGSNLQARTQPEIVTALDEMIATKATVYTSRSQFVRDWVTKGLRFVADESNDPRVKQEVARMMIFVHAEERKARRVSNKNFLTNMREEIDNAVERQEYRGPLELMKKAASSFSGQQLQDLQRLIAECEGRLR
jgi:Arc/MetJ-type ribon-helix-helix transcriptional regulator